MLMAVAYKINYVSGVAQQSKHCCGYHQKLVESKF